MRRLLYNFNCNVRALRPMHIIPRTSSIIATRPLSYYNRNLPPGAVEAYLDCISLMQKNADKRYAEQVKARSQRITKWISFLNSGFDNKGTLINCNVKKNSTGHATTVSFKMRVDPSNREKLLKLNNVMPQLDSNDIVHYDLSLTNDNSGFFTKYYLEGTVKLYD
jgi:hypothetical protein